MLISIRNTQIANAKKNRAVVNSINDISKIKFTIFDINDPLNTIIIKKKLNGNINGLILKNNRILIQLLGTSKYIECNYKFMN